MANGNQMAPLDETSDFNLKYTGGDKSKSFTISDGADVLANAGFFSRNTLKNKVFDYYSRHGYKNVYNQEYVTSEALFFTKPDLNLFDGTASDNATLNSDISNVPFFTDAFTRHPKSMFALQSSIRDLTYGYCPFMYLLSNCVTSKLDLPSISADSQSSTANLFSTEISYRSHSFKSDQAYDFSLSFKDTGSLDLYWLVKVYDEYIRRLRVGEISPKHDYIINHVLSDQFSIYKFLLGQDGETILYWAKLTGVYFTDVPRSDFGDPQSPFSYSLSFHAQFVEDNDLTILSEFNTVSGTKSAGTNYSSNYEDVYDADTGVVSNTFVRKPYILRSSWDQNQDSRAKRFGTGTVYRLKWIK